jgi:hypothetical protein
MGRRGNPVRGQPGGTVPPGGNHQGKGCDFLLVAVKWQEKEMDETGSLAKAYDISGYRERIIINRNQKIVGKTFAKEEWDSINVNNLPKAPFSRGLMKEGKMMHRPSFCPSK